MSEKYTLISLGTYWLIYLETEDGLVFFRRDHYGSCIKETKVLDKVLTKYFEDEDFVKVWVLAGGDKENLKTLPYPFLWDLI